MLANGCSAGLRGWRAKGFQETFCEMTEEIFDVAVIGAGFGGVYAAHRFRDEGLSVIGIEGASGVGGTWYHNGYPGSRVDTDSIDLYSYLFSRVIYDGWQWKERYAAQPELMEHLNWVVDKLDLRRLFRFDTWLREAQWSSEDRHWHLKTDGSNEIACRFLVMCTGNLSVPKPVSFPGLDRFKGEWLQSNRWPHREVRFKGRRVAIVGTGSSGVQAVPVVAREAEHLFVFQRTPHYAVPARNGPPNLEKQREISGNLEDFKESMLGRPTLPMGQEDRKPAAQYTPGEQRERMERQWVFGGHGMAYVFEDIGINRDSNEIAAEFVREKIRERVKDPLIAEKLCPDYPIGTRRLILEIDYYECFNQAHVSLVDMREDPIEEITETGIRTRHNHYDVDLIIFALGFRPFLGAIDKAGVVNEKGQAPRDIWARGPRTVFGLMTPGFPNFFHPTNAGSPSVLGPLILENEFHVDWIADCIEYMRRSGYSTVEATEKGADIWGRKSAAVSENMIRRQVDNYMVHVNPDDGSRIFQPWAGGMATYVPEVRRMTAQGYAGFAFK
ncbi:MAG: flavin-containing monooxygenase [Rhizomicrobium sp.]